MKIAKPILRFLFQLICMTGIAATWGIPPWTTWEFWVGIMCLAGFVVSHQRIR